MPVTKATGAERVAKCVSIQISECLYVFLLLYSQYCNVAFSVSTFQLKKQCLCSQTERENVPSVMEPLKSVHVSPAVQPYSSSYQLSAAGAPLQYTAAAREAESIADAEGNIM